MLGEKRNNSIFNTEPTKVAETPPPPPKPINDSKIIDKAILETAKSHEKTGLDFTQKSHGIFNAETHIFEYAEVLKLVQEHMADNYSELIGGDLSDSKDHMKRYIAKYILDKKIAVDGMSSEQIVDSIYTEMAEYGFLTKYIFGNGIEEIDINSWNDIEVQYSNGETVKLDEHFDSPEHAVNVIRRMLHVSGMVLDNAQPVVLGHLSKNIRIAVMKTPIVDEDVGIAASIRIVNPQSMKKSDFTERGTATDEMLDFLSTIIRYGVSVCVAGATSSGKTTMLGWLLTTIPDHKRVYTIENGSRELDLVRTDENGKVVNSVIHTITRESDNDKLKIDQTALLDVALRFNPDLAIVGEMRGAEANAAQEMARTGIAVLTTIHSNSASATYRRMVSLCKRAIDMSDETLMQYVTEAYPIIVFCKQLENKDRRLMEIMECEILDDGTRVYRTIYQYVITENTIIDGKFNIVGEHQKLNGISHNLGKRLLENGMPMNEIERWKGVAKIE